MLKPPPELACLECGAEAGLMRESCFLCHGERKPGWTPPEGLPVLDAAERSKAWCPTRSYEQVTGPHGRGCKCEQPESPLKAALRASVEAAERKRGERRG